MATQKERDEFREWLQRGAARDPQGWEASFVELFGLAGAVELLLAQGGEPHVLLALRPFAGNQKLKDAVRSARLAVGELASMAHEVAWDALRAKRESA